MPTIQYPNNPNTDTAFVEQDDGTKNRALMTAPQDTSTLELPSNPNSTKGYVTVDGKKQRVILTADIGGGGSVDYAKTVQRAETMPTADASNAGQQFLYSGESDATYTHGYIYENVKTATYTGTVSFEAATLSGTTVTCSGDNFANFLTEAGADPTPIASGTMTYEADATGWRLVGKDSNDNTVTTFIEYVEDYEDAGFVFTGTPQDNDVIAFTCTVEEASATYTWTRIDVQPTPEALPDQTGQSGKFLTTNGTSASWGTVGGLPSQTGQSGKFLTTDGTDASWSDKPLANKDTTFQQNCIAIALGNTVPTGPNANGSVVVGGRAVSNAPASVVIGEAARSDNNTGIAIGANARANNLGGVAIGGNAVSSATGAIQIVASWNLSYTNSDANTFKVANANGNFELMNANGNLPADRLASTSGLADGNYRLRLVMASGVPTLSWVAE